MNRNRLPGACPVCGSPFDVTHLHCAECGTGLEGRFELCKFCRLTREQQEFIEVFIKSRGNIREVERELGISYPTVRGRLDQAIEALGYRVEAADEEERGARRKAVLDSLSKGEISSEEAIKLLKQADRG